VSLIRERARSGGEEKVWGSTFMAGVEDVAGDRRLRRQSVEESLVKPEQQPVDLGLVAVVTVGHITLAK